MKKDDLERNLYKLKGPLAKKGYDWWWHNFTAKDVLTGEEKSFYIEFFIANPKLSPNEVILGQTSNHRVPSYFMINCGTWGKDHRQIHEFYPISKVSIDNKKLDIRVDDLRLTETTLKGHCTATKEDALNHAKMTDEGSMTWDLTMRKEIGFNVGYGAGKFMRFLNAFEMYWHAQGIKTIYEGTVTYNGKVYVVSPSESYGYADKNWGSDFTSPWLWIGSSDLYSKTHDKKLENSAIEFGGGRPKVFGISLNEKILGCIYLEGEKIEFNFSKFWKRSSLSFSFEETEHEALWHIEGYNKKYRFDMHIKTPLDEMMEINYEAPNGLKLHNHLLNGGTGVGTLIIKNKKNDILDEIEFKHTGCEYGVFG